MLIVIAGWVSAALVFASFFMKTMVPLRLVAICSNIAFMTYAFLGLHYGVFGRVYPILVLHASLLPLNVIRLRQQKALIRAVSEASQDETIRSLVSYMQEETHVAGEVLFKQGDPADRLYVIQHGQVRFPEIGKVVREGQVFGEVGLFAPQNVRAVSAVCEDDSRLYTISRETVLGLYYQSPKFGLFLIRLVAGLVLESQAARNAVRGLDGRPGSRQKEALTILGRWGSNARPEPGGAHQGSA
jgi:CRP/FNR family cyclic AMP-dependent transcriptional regulator